MDCPLANSTILRVKTNEYPFLRDLLPNAASDLKTAFQLSCYEEVRGFADLVDSLRVYGRCPCDLEDCADFYTVPPEEGPWPGSATWSIPADGVEFRDDEKGHRVFYADFLVTEQAGRIISIDLLDGTTKEAAILRQTIPQKEIG